MSQQLNYKPSMLYSLFQDPTPFSARYMNIQVIKSQRKTLNQISLFNKFESQSKINLFAEKIAKSNRESLKHSKNSSHIRLAPIIESSRNSIDSILSKLPTPCLQQSESVPIITKKSTLHKIPTNKSVKLAKTIINCVSRCSFKTRTGSTLNMNKKVNQDNYIIHSNLLGKRGQYLFAVCDGHGEEGHLVTSLVKSKFVSILEQKLSKSHDLDQSHAESLVSAISSMNEEILSSKIDTEYSGSTLVCTLIIGSTLLCANLGDSRAVVGRKLGKWESFDLSNDHKPSLSQEAERIKKNGGRVEISERGGALRIWFKDENKPGLAMTRSLGDKASRKIGLISEAEIVEKNIEKCDKFIILATDGVWDHISSEEAVLIVAQAWKKGKSESCCETLMKEAVNKWVENSDCVDDITIIVVFLKTSNV